MNLFSKKELLIIGCAYVVTILIAPFLLCGGLFVYDWIKTEIACQNWLNENNLRVDFSKFNTRDEVREALLVKLPVGTPEEELKAFYLANRSQEWSETRWEPDAIESFCWSYSKFWGFSCNYGVIFRVDETKRGPILRRMFSGEYIIVFELEPVTNSLKDIQVGYINQSINL